MINYLEIYPRLTYISDDIMKDYTIKHYVCARCWRHLVAFPGERRGWLVGCICDDCDGVGFVSRHWTEKEREADYIDYRFAMEVFGHLLNKPQNKTADVLLKELGF